MFKKYNTTEKEKRKDAHRRIESIAPDPGTATRQRGARRASAASLSRVSPLAALGLALPGTHPGLCLKCGGCRGGFCVGGPAPFWWSGRGRVSLRSQKNTKRLRGGCGIILSFLVGGALRGWCRWRGWSGPVLGPVFSHQILIFFVAFLCYNFLSNSFLWGAPMFSSSGSVVLVGGSRSLPLSALAGVSFVASCLSASPCSFVVGCAAGADAAFVSALVPLVGAGRVRMFSAGVNNPGVTAAARANVEIIPAGGPASLPFRARLVRRSAAAAAVAGAGVFVVSSPDSRGSLGTASFLARRGCPVRFFTTAPFVPSGLPGLSGVWVGAGTLGELSAWCWLPNGSSRLL